MAQKILIHVLLGQRVISNQQHAYELRSALMGSFMAIRHDETMTREEKDGYITILEEALSALEFRLFRDLCGWTGFRSCAAPTRCCGVG